LKDPGVDGRILLKVIYETWDGGIMGMDLGTNLEYGKEPSGSVKFG
jgi:hypothetical protein